MGDELDLAHGYRDVDASDSALLAAWLDTLAAHPDFRALKAASIGLLDLRPGMVAVEVGCGVGDEVRTMAHIVGPSGRAVGIDSSAGMIARARSRLAPGALPGCELVVADAHALPIEDATVDAVRIERTLQHVEDPPLALAEVARVLRPGGRLVAWEPDWGTLMVAGTPGDVGDLVCARRTAAFRQPRLGRELPGMVAAAGLLVERVDTGVHKTLDPAFGEAEFSFLREARLAVAEGVLTSESCAAWEADLARRAEDGGYLAAVSAVRVLATRPASSG